MNFTKALTFCGASILLLGAGSMPDPERTASPPPSPKPATPPGQVMFSDVFGDGRLEGWRSDKTGVWSVRRGVLRADLPDERQQRSFLYAGSDRWTNYAVDVDVCAMRSRGRYPSCAACDATEYAPVITACDAMTVAAVASTTIGQRPHSGTRRKNGPLMLAGSPRISAPCPI